MSGEIRKFFGNTLNPRGLFGRSYDKGERQEDTDPRTGSIRDALDLPESTPELEVLRFRHRIQTRREQLRSGDYQVTPEEAGYFPQEYLEEYGVTEETQENLITHFAHFYLSRYIDFEGVGNMQDVKGSIHALEEELGMASIKQRIQDIANPTDDQVNMSGLLRAHAKVRLRRELKQHADRKESTAKITAEVVNLANKFPDGTEIAIDDTATPTCRMPDGTMIKPIVGEHKTDDPYIIEYRTANGEKGTITFSRNHDTVPPLNLVIQQAMDVLAFSHTYFCHMDSIKKYYEHSDASVAISVAKRNVKPHGLQGFRYFLEKLYGEQTESTEIK